MSQMGHTSIIMSELCYHKDRFTDTDKRKQLDQIAKLQYA